MDEAKLAQMAGNMKEVGMLKPLLVKLQPYGKVHLASCFLSKTDLHQLRGLYDVLHTPQHSPDGYCNFELFSIRDINRLATAPYFVKLDADIHLEPDWIKYVEECLARYSDVVLFGPRKGNVNITFQISSSDSLLFHAFIFVLGTPSEIRQIHTESE